MGSGGGGLIRGWGGVGGVAWFGLGWGRWGSMVWGRWGMWGMGNVHQE